MANSIQVPVVQTGLGQSINNAVRQIGPINVPININPAGFQNLAQPLGKITGLATEFEKSIAASNARVLAFGASVGIINGVQNALSDLVKSGIEVQKTLTEIGSISGQTGDQLRKFGNDIFDAAKNTGNSFKVASEAALEFSRQGLSAQETIKRTNDALTLSRFTNLSAAESVDTLTAAINTFSEAGVTSSEIINKLVAVDTKFAVSAEDLAKGISRAGSIAQEVGVSFDQLNAAITVAQEKTARGGSVIGNALKTIFTNIRSDKAVEALRAVGVESLDAQGKLKGAIPLLQELSEKMKTMSGGERIQLLETVASKYNINILSSLLDDLNNANSKFGQAVKVSAGAGNEAYERLSTLNKTLAADINRATQSLTQFYSKLSEIGVTEGLSNMLKFVNNLLDGLNKLLDSEGVGGNIARGLIKGLSDIFFSVGLPIIAAIFVKLTSDIAKFGVESLKTILGINQQVRERAALEQAVVNTLIKDQQIMANILAMGNDRARQEQYLLSIYEAQINALQTVKNISGAVAPGLMGAGLSAMSGTVTKRSAGGYLPAQEAADVSRGVGGANPSASVVAIPNFAFGGGKFGTMIANSSEYIVPNFANGGSAIFNQDMVKAYGLPAGAQKIAADGYVPSFARYVYDSDRIEPDKNALLKAILASGVKKNLIVGPAGSGKSTYGAGLGSFITSASQLADATEVDILSSAARSKDGGMSKNFQQILGAVNASGGKVSYLYAGNMDIYSRRVGRAESGAMEGDLRSSKQLSGSLYAPMNQFDFISQIKGGASNFEMLRGAGGFIPNFALDLSEPEFVDKYAGIVPSRVAGPATAVGRAKNGKLYSFPMIYAGSGAGSKGNVDEIRNHVIKTSQSLASANARDYALAFNPSLSVNYKNVEEKATQANQNKGAIESFVGSIFEASIAALLDDNHFKESQARSSTSTFDFANKPELQKIFGIPNTVQFLEAKNNAETSNLNKIADKISRVEAGKAAFSTGNVYFDNPSRSNGKSRGRTFTDVSGGNWIEDSLNNFRRATPQDDLSRYQKGVGAPPGATFRGASGYIPNFANPLGDAIHREMAAGLSPNQISVTQDGRLRNAGNPQGLAVINSRDEPNGRIPNFANIDFPRPVGMEKAQYDNLRAAINTEIATLQQRNASEQEVIAAIKALGVQYKLTETGLKTLETSAQKMAQTFAPGTILGPNGNPINSVSGPNATGNTAAQGGSNNPKDAMLTTNRLMLAFGGLTMITAQLQSNFRDTNNSLAKFITGLSQVAQSASGYGMVGGMLGEATKNREGILGKMSGYMGPAGAILGAGIGIYSAVQESRAAEKAGYVQRGESEAQRRLDSIRNLSLNEKEQMDMQRQAVTEAAQRIQRLRSQQGKEQLDVVNASEFGGEAFAAGAVAQKYAPDIEAATAEKNKLQKNLQAQQDSFAERESSRARQEAAAQGEVLKELRERIALSTKLNEIEIAFAEGQNKSLVKRAETRALEIANSANLTNSEKQQLELSQKLTDIENERADVKNQVFNKALQELTSASSLTSVDKSRLESLVNRIRSGEKINDLEAEFKSLGEQGALEAKKILASAEKDVVIQENKLKTTSAITRELGNANILLNAQVELQNTLLQGIKNKLELEKEYNNLVLQGSREIEDVTAKQGVFDIKQGIARGGLTPTRAQKAALTQAEFSYNLGQQTTGINRTFENTSNSAFEKYKSGALNALGGVQNIRPEDKAAIEKAISEATGPQGVQDALTQGIQLLRRNQITSTAAVGKYSGGANIKMQLPTYAEDASKVQQINNLEAQAEGLLRNKNKALEDARVVREKALQQLEKELSLEARLVVLAKEKPALAGGIRAVEGIKAEIEAFPETFAYNTTNAFRDGLRDAMGAAISDSANLGQALQGIAQGFLKTMQSAFLQNASNNIVSSIMPKMGVKFAAGGLVSGGSGYMDDVPAMLTGGEFVMTKSAVQKYGVGNLAKMNSGGVFLPGVRGGGDISGIDALRAFANQTTTSGATDITRGTGSSAYLSLEDQSAKLSRWALLNNDTIGGEIRSAQEQGLNAISQYDAYRTQQRKAMQQQIVGTLASAALSYGVGKLTAPAASAYKGINIPKSSDMLVKNSPLVSSAKPFSMGPMSFGSFTNSFSGRAYGGPTDDTPAMLMSGEFVMNRGAARKYGTDFLNSMNSGRAPRFADGGAVDVTAADSAPSNKKAAMNGDINISINVASNGSSDTKTQGGEQGAAGGVDYKKMSERIKAVVLETIQEEKRLGGALRR